MTTSLSISRKPAQIILLLALLQVLCSTWFLRIDGFHAINSILFLLSGFAISYFILKLPDPVIERPGIRQTWIKGAFILVLILISYFLARRIMDKTPLEKEYADMLPIMKVMCNRFVEGRLSQVYDPIPEIWNGIQPIYLPGFWLPFTSSVIFHFDMRWVTVSGIWLSILLCIWPGKWKLNTTYFLYGLAILVLLAWLHFDKVNNVIRLTEEGVVFFYYSLLAVAIISRKAWLIGIAAAFCLLSRYAMIGWMPFAFLYLLFTRQHRFLLQTLAAGIAVILLLVIIPFGWKPLLIHWELHNNYMEHAERIWRENPEFFNQSLGMAKFFGAGNTGLLHTVLLIGSFILPLFFLVLVKKKTVSSNIALLSCLQFCITVFYNFLDVSYLYLYYAPVFVSLAIAGWSLSVERDHPSLEHARGKDHWKRWIKQISPFALSKNHRYDRLTSTIIRKHCTSQSNCIDVGCHKGEVLDEFLKVAPKGTHFAFEPVPALFQHLVRKYENEPHCLIYDYALGNAEGATAFNYVISNPAYSGIKKRKYDRDHEKDQLITVEQKRLDDIIPSDTKIDLIKIDVEGGDLDVMVGAKRLITTWRPLIIFEFGIGGSDIYGANPEKFFDFLNEISYEVSLLDSFLKKRPPLTLQDFHKQFTKRLNHYFIAHPH